ncbi:type II toxin-antitoxin system PemK/MazF family toxin [Methylosoma difficile]
MVKRGEVYWVNLDPILCTEIKKTRPALFFSHCLCGFQILRHT